MSFVNYISIKLEIKGKKNKIRMQKEMLKANKPPGLLYLYNSNGLNVKSNVMGILKKNRTWMDYQKEESNISRSTMW